MGETGVQRSDRILRDGGIFAIRETLEGKGEEDHGPLLFLSLLFLSSLFTIYN